MSCCGADLEQLLDARLFKALSDPTRLAVLGQVAGAGCACTVGEVAQCCQVDLSVVSRHLALLRDAGVLEATRDGRQVRYRVRARELAELLRRIADAVEQCCPDGR